MKKNQRDFSKRLIFNPQNPFMTVRTCQPHCGSFWNLLPGWLSRTSRMHQSEGSFLLHWQEPGLRDGSEGYTGKACTSCTQMAHTREMHKEAWSRGRGALLYFTHTHQSVPYRFLPYKKIKLIRKTWWIFEVFFAIFFYSFRILHL